MRGEKTVSLKTTDKQIALRRLKDIVRIKELEREGLPVSADFWGAPIMAIPDLVEEYRRALLSKGRKVAHIHDTCKRILRVSGDCGWSTLQDINLLSFEQWRAAVPRHSRSGAPLSAKSLNEYLFSLKAFLNWLVKLGRLEKNPIANADRVETRGMEKKMRRAWTIEELGQFMSVPPPYKVDYRPAVFLLALTGLRKNELQKLRWGDVDLDTDVPRIRIRAENSKNKKSVELPLLTQVADYLLQMRPPNVNPGRYVIDYTIPSNQQFINHIKKAGLTYRNEMGDIDFHSLRHTFGTLLTINGVPQREIQFLMRHSDANLTANRYTDVSQLPVAKTLKHISEKIQTENCTRICTRPLDSNGRLVSQPDKVITESTDSNIAENQDVILALSQTATEWHDFSLALPTGVEPVSQAPEARILSIELWELRRLEERKGWGGSN